jgi:hypothetical protein
MKNKQIAVEEMLMVNNIMKLEEYVGTLWVDAILDAYFDDYLNFRLEKIKNPNYSYKDVPVFNDHAEAIKNKLSDFAITFDSWFVEKSTVVIDYVLNKTLERFIDEQINSYIEVMKLKLDTSIDDQMNEFLK